MKRQECLYWASAVLCDFVLILDSDEYLDNDRRHGASMWPEFVNELRFIKYQHPTKYHIYGIRFFDIPRYKRDGYPKFISNESCRPRLIFRPEHVKYTKNHYTFNYPDEPKFNIVSPLTIYHDPLYCRDEIRIRANERYKRMLPWIE